MRPVLLFTWLLAAGLSAEPTPPRDHVRVSVLGYHDFSETAEETEMRIRTSKFRDQMQALKDLGLPVIPMADFQAWKRGEKSIPDKSVVITIDDGWKSVYTDAYPVLREFGYPFTLFLYKNYVDGGGKALTTPMIREMIGNGATLGSHSVSHPYPATVKKHRREGPDAYDAFLRREMGESKRFLESGFGSAVTTYAYPGGYHTQEMFTLAEEFGYTQLFTVLPAKVRRDTPDAALPRYVILGTHDHIFQLATAFTDTPGTGPGNSLQPGLTQTTQYPVTPEPGAIVEDRLAEITAHLGEVEGLDPDSLEMTVGGFGKVPAVFDGEAGTLSWKPNRRLRSDRCQVQVSWKDREGKAPALPLRWAFQIDQEAAYVPRN